MAGSPGDQARVRRVRQDIPHREDPLQSQAARPSQGGQVIPDIRQYIYMYPASYSEADGYPMLS